LYRETYQDDTSEESKKINTISEYIYNEIANELLREFSDATFKVVTDIQFNPALIKKKLSRELYKKMFRVSIKTLPFFNINSLDRLYSGAFLIVKNIFNPIFGVSEVYNFLTGIYFIEAFRHVITVTSSYSEFTLRKDVDVGGVEA
jgi:hypothetical protein